MTGLEVLDMLDSKRVPYRAVDGFLRLRTGSGASLTPEERGAAASEAGEDCVPCSRCGGWSRPGVGVWKDGECRHWWCADAENGNTAIEDARLAAWAYFEYKGEISWMEGQAELALNRWSMANGGKLGGYIKTALLSIASRRRVAVKGELATLIDRLKEARTARAAASWSSPQ